MLGGHFRGVDYAMDKLSQIPTYLVCVVKCTVSKFVSQNKLSLMTLWSSVESWEQNKQQLATELAICWLPSSASDISSDVFSVSQMS